VNRLALDYLDVALWHQEERDEIRALLVDLLIAITRNKELLSFARGEIEAR
jgi:hypothetical protein